jgi:hypothetical protein
MSIVGSLLYNPEKNPVFIPVYWADAKASPSKLDLGEGEGGGESNSFGINNLGQIVGTVYYESNSTPVYWANASASPMKLKFTGGVAGFANGINILGQIVGGISYGSSPSKAVYWSDASASPITLNERKTGGANGINNSGQIVGFFNDDDLESGNPIPVYWANTSASPMTLNFTGGSGGKAYGINNSGQIVGGISYEGTIPTPVYWANASASPVKLNFTGGIGGIANGINNLGQIVGYINNEGGVPTPVYWADYSASPVKLNVTGGLGGTANGIADPPAPTPTPTPAPTPEPISNICFPAGTPIQTDQGIVNIDRIDKNIHTIRQKPILHVTRTTASDNYLISIEKNSFGRNVPHTKTLMTRDHKIMFEGRLVSAYRFLDYTDTVKKVKYNGETLYNILLADYGTINVNNLICETLHPENIIAKLYMQNYTDTERTALVYQMNTALTNNDFITYKSVIHRINSNM